MPTRRCQGTTKAGKPCQARALVHSEYCVAHEPALAAERAEWRRQGGQRRGKRAVLEQAAALQTPEEVKDLLGRTIVGVQRGEIDPSTANAIARLCSLQLKAIKDTDLAHRLQRLETLFSDEGG